MTLELKSRKGTAFAASDIAQYSKRREVQNTVT
jgi:hypothetical protein